MGLMKRFDDPHNIKNAPKKNPAGKKSSLIMGPFIEKITGALGVGDFRLFENVYKDVIKDVNITRERLQWLLELIGYGIQKGKVAGKSVLIVEGFPVDVNIKSTPVKLPLDGKGIFQQFDVRGA